MLKKTISVFAASLLILSGCGNSSKDTDSINNNAFSTAAATDTAGENESTGNGGENESKAEEINLKDGRFPVTDGKVEVWLPSNIVLDGGYYKGTFSFNFDQDGLLRSALRSVVYGDGTEENKDLNFSYDSDWKLTSYTDRNYDLTDDYVKSSVTKVSGFTSAYINDQVTAEVKYNDSGLIESIGDVYSFEYDEQGKPVKIIHNGTSGTDTATYTYNEKHLIDTITLSNDNSDKNTPDYSFSYDENGCLTKFTSGWGNVQFSYTHEKYYIPEEKWEQYSRYLLYNIYDTFYLGDNDTVYFSYINDGVFQEYLMHKFNR